MVFPALWLLRHTCCKLFFHNITNVNHNTGYWCMVLGMVTTDFNEKINS